ncbi:MAG: dephospho-CoA kinase [Bacteroidaceae bacterium]|nr:dephospho-CoA kinase [Bacteroidaceae bacterium]
MIRLAVIGGIGSGKSVVSRMMEIMGVPVYDCDTRAKELMVKDAFIVKELKRMFGDECYDADGALDRKYVASRIFVDERNTKRVNALVHPVVKDDFCSWVQQQNAPVVAVETALLYESGMVDVVDKVLVVWTDKETAITRTMKRSGMTREQVHNRMVKQMTADDLLLLSDYSIYNGGANAVMPDVVALLETLTEAR